MDATHKILYQLARHYRADGDFERAASMAESFIAMIVCDAAVDVPKEDRSEFWTMWRLAQEEVRARKDFVCSSCSGLGWQSVRNEEEGRWTVKACKDCQGKGSNPQDPGRLH